jgi:hypothetical protein
MPRTRELVIALILVVFALAVFLSPDRLDEPAPSGLPTSAGIAGADPDSDLTGLVVDEAGRPVPGAIVRCDIRPYGRCVLPGSDLLRPEVEGPNAVTARDGTFKLEIGRDAIADLCIRPKAHGEKILGHRRAGDHVRVVVTRSVDVFVDVKDEAGAPLADARVFILRVVKFRKPMHWHSGVTDARGRRDFRALTADEMMIMVDHPTHRQPEMLRVEPKPGVPVEVEIAMVKGEGGRLRRGLPITDRAFRGRVAGPNDEPINDARIVLGDRTSRPTGEVGRFHVETPPKPPVLLAVWAPGYGRYVERLDGWPKPRTIRLASGHPVTGKAPENAVVELDPGVPGGHEIAIADARDTYRFRDVAPGDYTLRILPPNGPAQTKTITVPRND